MATKEEIEQLIQEERGQIEDALDEACERRDSINKEIAQLRAKLDDAPKLHVKRRTKPRLTVDQKAAAVVQETIRQLEVRDGEPDHG